jgi:gluconolactonase
MVFGKMQVIAAVLVIGATVSCTTAPQKTETAAARTTTDANAIARLDPGLDALISPAASIDKVSSGFKFLEGPLWRPQGVLWFSDLVGNVVHQWSPDGKVTDILNPGGFDGKNAPEGGYIGPNGMVAGPDNTVMLCQHGNRRIVRLAADHTVSVLVDRYQGKRLNSPNDLVYAPDGALYFTDPPFGLPKQNDDPAKELKFNGVFRFAQGKLEPVIQDLGLPNGIAFSPDHHTLYVSNSEPNKRLWMRCDVATAGAVSNCRVFADATSSPDQGVPDGMKVDSSGNVYATGPGGVWVFSPDGKHLGTIRTPESPSNCAWGDDGKTLYITAVTSLYKVRVNIPGEKALYN